MRKLRCSRRIAILLTLVSGMVVTVRAGDMPTVAVVDFVTPDQPADSALLGLGDLLEVELSRYGLNVISRRDLNLLLGERRLSRKGFARMEDFQGGILPWADFLVRCDFRQEGRTKAWATLRLVDARTSIEVKTWNLAATRPMEALEEISHHVPQVVATILQRGIEELKPRPTPGFTDVPEAARTFYRGLDHLVRGQPGYAAEYFRLAAEADNNFAFAVLGQAKAYDYLGFPRVGDALRATLPAEETPKARNSGTGSVLTVRFVDRGGEFTPKSMDHIRGLLQGTYGFSLFEPDWIPALTRETDLKLTGEFPLVHGLDSRLWLRAEHMLVFSAGEKELRASAIDLLRGQLMGTVTSDSNDLDTLCQQAVAAIRRPADSESAPPLERVASRTGPPVHLTGTFSIDEIATALQRVADRPDDMACWSHLMVLIQAHPGYSVVFRAFVPYFNEAIPRDTPDTPVWLAAAGWMSYVYDAELVGKPLPMDGHFTELLEQYPDHMQSDIVRYNAAMVRAYRGELPLDLPAVLQAQDRAAQKIAAMHDFVQIPGQYIEGIAQVDYRSFPNVLPPHGPRMTLLARGLHYTAAIFSQEAGMEEEAKLHFEKYRQLRMPILYGQEVAHQFTCPMTIFPTILGLWQTGHIGYQWQPEDPADAGRVLVGWTFMPYPLPGWKSLQQPLRESQVAISNMKSEPPPAGARGDNAKRNTAPSPGRTKSLGEQAIEEYLSQNPNLGEQLRAQHEQRMADHRAFREHPSVAKTGGIFLPHQYPVASSLRLSRDNLSALWDSLADAESQYGHALTVEDITADDSSSIVYAMALFTRRTVEKMKNQGTEAGLRYARDFIETYAAQREEFLYTWYPEIFDEMMLEMCWMTAGALEMTGDGVGARQLCKQALAVNPKSPLAPSIRYLEARVAHQNGQDFEASEILRELIETPKSADTPIRLPDETRKLGSLYIESVALLKAIRREEGDIETMEPALPDTPSEKGSP